MILKSEKNLRRKIWCRVGETLDLEMHAGDKLYKFNRINYHQTI